MEDAKYANLIRSLETFAAEKPGLYRWRVALVAALGYAYLLFILLLLLGVVALTVFYLRFNWLTIKLVWIPLAVVGLVLKSLWISIPEPDGKELQREDAPALFDLIGEVTRALRGPKVHHVFLSDEFNAAVVQVPRFGMFGWVRNYVVVGLPLLRGLSPAEFRAVMAHEVGHLSGKHQRFSGRMYSLRQSWIQLLIQVLQERHYASFLFVPFIKWYAPYMSAYSFVLRRAQERHADEYAVEWAGKEVAATMLVRLATEQRNLAENFWPRFFRQSKDQPRTPRDPFVQMLGGLNQPVGPITTQKWFYEELRIPTGYDDTHPALADRLAAIGFPKDSPQLATLTSELIKADERGESAESYYIKELPEDFLEWLNRLWRERLNQAWNESHIQARQGQKRLDELNNLANERPLTIDEQWERVTIVSQLEEPKAALPLIEGVLSEQPDHVAANFWKGAILLKDLKNPDGIKHLEKAMQLDRDSIAEGSTLLSGFYFDQGKKDLAEEFRLRAEEHFKRQEKQQEKAVNFSEKDHFIPHGLDEQKMKEIREQVSKVYGLDAAFLVRKVIEEPDTTVYVLGVMAAYTWSNGQSGKHVDLLFQELGKLTVLPSPLVFLSLDGEYFYLQKVLSSVDGAQVYATAEAGLTYRH
jgi:Zn-dependent protease with chaperone function